MRGLPFDPATILGAVAGLSNAELGVHLRLIAYVASAGCVPADDAALRRIVPVASKEDRLALKEVLTAFFVPNAELGGAYVPKRAPMMPPKAMCRSLQ